MGRTNLWWFVVVVSAVAIGGSGGWWIYQKVSANPDSSPIKMDAGYEFSASTWSGSPVKFGDFAGKVLLVNFWASWCGPCAAEFPHMLKLLDRYPERLAMVAFSADQEKAEVARFLRAFNGQRANLFVVWDPLSVVSSRYQATALPETLVFSPAGSLLFRAKGARDWSAAGALETAEVYLSK